MCQLDPSQLETLVRHATAHTGALVLPGHRASPVCPSDAPPAGSRRRRLWELSDHAHCPVIGVGLSIAVLRRLVDKALGAQALANDYDLHCGAIGSSKHRTPLAEAIQRELDRRYLPSIRQAAKLKTTEALSRWWEGASLDNLAGTFWATLTHARCTTELEHSVLGKVHMIQHQVGTVVRSELQRFEALLDENEVLSRVLAAAQARNTTQAQEHALHSEAQQAQIVQLRAELIGKETTHASLKDEFVALEAQIPDLQSRAELTRQCEQHLQRIHQLERKLLQAQQEAERQQRRAEGLAADVHSLRLSARPQAAEKASKAAPGISAAQLQDRAVLCVGGRQASVPAYRQLIEEAGGRFLHHDGGEEESVAKLDATLAAADLVICQTGCISHNAYWRVKDHCKRTGKQCVFVENPSTTSLVRGLTRGLVSTSPVG